MADDMSTVRVGAANLLVSEQTAEWLNAQPVQGGPAQVLARYAARSQDEWRAERREADRVAASRARAEDRADAARMGLGPPMHTHAELLAGYAAMSEIEDAREDARRSKELETRAIQREQRIVELQAELAKERARSADGDLLASAYRARALAAEAERYDDQQRGNYPRSYVRNYWQ